MAPSPVPGLASRAQAVSGQGRSLDREVLWGKDAIWERRLLHQGDHFPLQNVREEVSVAEPLTRTRVSNLQALIGWQHLPLSSAWRSTSVQRQSSSESGALWGLKDRVRTRRWSGFPGPKMAFYALPSPTSNADAS